MGVTTGGTTGSSGEPGATGGLADAALVGNGGSSTTTDGGGSLASAGTTSSGGEAASGIGGSSGASGVGGSYGGSAGAGGLAGTGGTGGSAGSGGGTGGAADAGPGCTRASFNGHSYLLCKAYLTWTAAETQCQASGMHLARINDAAENQWIVDTLEGTPLPVDSGPSWIWVGGTDAATEGSWLWPDGILFYQSGPIGGLYTNWLNSEPNNGRGGENCLADRVSYRWTDLACTELHYSCCEQ
jgi:hypothetical protein